MKRILTMTLAIAIALPAAGLLNSCSKDDTKETPENTQPEPEPEPTINTINFETLEVKSQYQADAYAYSPLDIATIILCGEGYGEKTIYGSYQVPDKGKYIRLELNIPKDSKKLIPEGTYTLVNNKEIPNTDYKPMTMFPRFTVEEWEMGTFYRDTDKDNYTFFGDFNVSNVKVTASTSIQDGYKLEVDLKDADTEVKAVYEGVIKFDRIL